MNTKILGIAALAVAAFAPLAAQAAGDVGAFADILALNAERAAKARAEVVQERDAARQQPAAVDGWRYVGGDLGWEREPARYVRVNGRWIALDDMRGLSRQEILDMLAATRDDRVARELHERLYAPN